MLVSGKAHKQLQGVASPTLERRNKYRPRKCNGDAASKLKFENMGQQTNRILIRLRSVRPLTLNKQPSNGDRSGDYCSLVKSLYGNPLA
jgi:hypothetical protein